jgi:hypothetical protein
MRLLALLLLSISLYAQPTPYKWSVAALVAANGMDYHSTVVALKRPGLREAHPWYANPDGSFRGQRVAVAKTSVIMGNLVLQRALINSPRTRKWATWVNFGVALAVTGIAVRNYKMQGSLQ